MLLKIRRVSGTGPATAAWLVGAAAEFSTETVRVMLVVLRLVTPAVMAVRDRPKASPLELGSSYSTGAVKFPTVGIWNQ